MTDDDCQPQTRLILTARRGIEGSVNPPVIRASTIQFPCFASLSGERKLPTRYGIRELDTIRQLHDIVTELEHAEGCVSTCSGLAAISLVFDAFLQQGDAVAITDNVYLPTRDFADDILKKRGHQVTYLPVSIGADIVNHLTPSTRLILLELPGSQTFEIDDLQAVVAAVRSYPDSKRIIIAVDNTWSAGVYFKPLDYGVDISLQAGTKYLAGHSDVLLGVIAASGEVLQRLRTAYDLRGDHLSPDDAYLTIRGARTLLVRLEQHQRSALAVARWLAADARVGSVCYPALTGHPQHALWKRTFTGASSLFSFCTRKAPTREALEAMLHAMRIFRMGFSWGGFESLLVPTWPVNSRTTQTSVCCGMTGQLFRLHVGLEHPDDLIADLDRALDAYISV